MVKQQVDLLEIACSPTSELSSTFEAAGYTTLRVNYKSGFDLDSKQGTSLLKNAIDEQNPKLAWVSMKCTRLSSLQNLTPRSPEQWDNFLKRRGQKTCAGTRRSWIPFCLQVAMWRGSGLHQPMPAGVQKPSTSWSRRCVSTSATFSGPALMDVAMVCLGKAYRSEKDGQF